MVGEGSSLNRHEAIPSVSSTIMFRLPLIALLIFVDMFHIPPFPLAFAQPGLADLAVDRSDVIPVQHEQSTKIPNLRLPWGRASDRARLYLLTFYLRIRSAGEWDAVVLIMPPPRSFRKRKALQHSPAPFKGFKRRKIVTSYSLRWLPCISLLRRSSQ